MKLTDKERRALEAVWRHANVKEAAKSLNVSPRTLQVMLCTIYRLLDVHNKTAAIRKAIELGLIEVLS